MAVGGDSVTWVMVEESMTILDVGEQGVYDIVVDGLVVDGAVVW